MQIKAREKLLATCGDCIAAIVASAKFIFQTGENWTVTRSPTRIVVANSGGTRLSHTCKGFSSPSLQRPATGGVTELTNSSDRKLIGTVVRNRMMREAIVANMTGINSQGDKRAFCLEARTISTYGASFAPWIAAL